MNTLADIKLLNWRSVDHSGRGDLVVIEDGIDVPFPIKRLFYVYGVAAGEHRGEHAHRECRQLLICLQGRCEIICDDGHERRTIILDSPEKGLDVPPMIWVEQNYPESGTVLLVLTDHHFSEEDYIRDYAEFLRIRRAPRQP